jgi:large subunit ribosomal protein L28
MAKCEITGKKPSYGNNVSHSNRHTRRVWKPNVQKVTLVDANGKRRTMRVAASTLRTLYKVR